MIELGVKQKLYIDHKTDFGVYLSDTPERNGKSDCVFYFRKSRFHRMRRLVMK